SWLAPAADLPRSHRRSTKQSQRPRIPSKAQREHWLRVRPSAALPGPEISVLHRAWRDDPLRTDAGSLPSLRSPVPHCVLASNARKPSRTGSTAGIWNLLPAKLMAVSTRHRDRETGTENAPVEPRLSYEMSPQTSRSFPPHADCRRSVAAIAWR